MRRRTRTGRALTAGTAATLVWVTAGTAAAAPPAGRAITVTHDGYALAALTSAEVPDLTVYLDVFDPGDRAPFADLEVFVSGFECVTGEEDSIPATMRTLRAADASGTLPLSCSSPAGETVLGEAVVVGVAWAGEGRLPPPEVIPRGPGVLCTLVVSTRDASVAGTVRVVVPDLGVDATATGDRGQLRHVTGICLPEDG